MITHQLAKSAGVKTSVIRYYTRIGLLSPDRNPENGYRQYAPADIERVRFIRKAKWLGFTISDIKMILDRADAGMSPCGTVRKIILDRLKENELRLKHLRNIQKRMEAAIESWEGQEDGPPGRHVCDLIDSLDYDEETLDLYAGDRF